MGRYRRTVSFPNPIPSFNPNPNHKSLHVRSVSLPCGRTHPLIPQLRDEITELQSWAVSGPRSTIRANSARMVDGLTRLKSVLDSLDDVLQLPQTQDSLSTRTDVVERLLEDFLKFVDVYETFHESMLGLKQEMGSAQVAVRRKDDSILGLYVKSHKKIAGDIGKLISAVGSISEHPNAVKLRLIHAADFHDELASAIHDVHRITASVSETVFGGVSGSYAPSRRPAWAGIGLGLKKVKKGDAGVEEFVKVLGGVENLLQLKKKKNNTKNSNNNNIGDDLKMDVLKGMKEMEECIGEMEKQSERVFRSLISNRVSLLNILTHA